MELKLDTTDLLMTSDWDFAIDQQTGNLETVDNVNSEVLTQMIIKRVFSRKNDWALQRDCGANLEQYRGEEITESLILRIKSNIITELNKEQMLKGRNIDVKVIVISDTELMILIFAKTDVQKDPVVISSSLSLDSYIPVSHKLRRV